MGAVAASATGSSLNRHYSPWLSQNSIRPRRNPFATGSEAEMKQFLLGFCMILVFSVSLFAQNDPFVGTWKFNRQKSNYGPARGPKSETRTIAAVGNGEKVSIHAISADGATHDTQYTCNFDEKDCSLGTPGDALARKRIDANTIESTVMKDGKVLYITRLVVSKDGKTMTVTAKGKNANRQAMDKDIAVYDKQ
jgi:hypothetical protein